MMSSQKDAGIPLNHAPDGIGYKLLELPLELLALLESDTPPVLTLESSTDSAILRSGAQSWALRQKNTSNALILLKPSDEASSSQIRETTLKAIATIHDTVELIVEAKETSAPVTKGKWHERFARGR
ncbi:hypothetical protein GGS26DRAFT_573267 [Hypomontagnella submonticulosa]|nr:hypothetical protein GGS26DRAFT_573267 [Hypomontagnella submonticulosa]